MGTVSPFIWQLPWAVAPLTPPRVTLAPTLLLQTLEVEAAQASGPAGSVLVFGALGHRPSEHALSSVWQLDTGMSCGTPRAGSQESPLPAPAGVAACSGNCAVPLRVDGARLRARVALTLLPGSDLALTPWTSPLESLSVLPGVPRQAGGSLHGRVASEPLCDAPNAEVGRGVGPGQ